MVIKVKSKVDEVIQLLQIKYYSEQDIWEALSLWYAIPYGEITKQFRSGKPIAKTILKKVTQLP